MSLRDTSKEPHHQPPRPSVPVSTVMGHARRDLAQFIQRIRPKLVGWFISSPTTASPKTSKSGCPSPRPMRRPSLLGSLTPGHLCTRRPAACRRSMRCIFPERISLSQHGQLPARCRPTDASGMCGAGPVPNGPAGSSQGLHLRVPAPEGAFTSALPTRPPFSHVVGLRRLPSRIAQATTFGKLDGHLRSVDR